MPKNYCIMQIWAESGKSALPICNYSQILYQFLTFTQNLKRSRKLCHTILLPTALPVGVFRLMPPKDGISPLTCTIFDPNIFLIFSKSIFFHISPTRLKSSIMGNYLDFALKIAHRGNTGSHRGKRKLGCVSEK